MAGLLLLRNLYFREWERVSEQVDKISHVLYQSGRKIKFMFREDRQRWGWLEEDSSLHIQGGMFLSEMISGTKVLRVESSYCVDESGTGPGGTLQTKLIPGWEE